MLDNSSESSNKKRGLGRGLGSLLGSGEAPPATFNQSAGEAPVASGAQDRIWKLAIDKLKPGDYQPRQNFFKESLLELSQSIKANGILQPIVARKKGDQFEIIAGERRWRAAQM